LAGAAVDGDRKSIKINYAIFALAKLGYGNGQVDAIMDINNKI
jgi:hypothetical protein